MKKVDLSNNKRIDAAMRLAREALVSEDVRTLLNTATMAFDEIHDVKAYMHVCTCDLTEGGYRLRRFISQKGEELVPRTDFDDNMESAPHYRGGLIQDLIATPVPKLFHDLDVPNDPGLGDLLAPYKSLLAVPMFPGGDALEWIVVLDERPDTLNADTVIEMIMHSNMLAVAINRDFVARELHAAHAIVQREVDEIARIQRSLLPAEMPEVPGLSLAAHYETFDRAGGDYYDVLPLNRTRDGHDPDGLWAIIVADASGHGPAAAVVMAMVHALFHSYSEAPHQPSEFLAHINANLQSHRVGYSFVTALMAIYDPKTRELRYANAGHPYPILMAPRPEGAAMRRLDAVGSIPLGIEENVHYEDASLVLAPGQSVVFYTDGIIESTSPHGDMFNVEGIESALHTCNGKPECVTLEVIDALKDHEAGRRARDDQTILAMHLEPVPGELSDRTNAAIEVEANK